MYTTGRRAEGDPLLRNRKRSPTGSMSNAHHSSNHRNHSADEQSSAGYQSIEQPLVDGPPLLEIPEEIYAVRKAALQVLKPLNKTWVRATVRPSVIVRVYMCV